MTMIHVSYGHVQAAALVSRTLIFKIAGDIAREKKKFSTYRTTIIGWRR